MQNGPSTPLAYPGSCKTCFSRKPVLIGQHALWSLPTAVLDDLFSSLGGYFEIISHSWLLNFIETRHASFHTSDITNWNYSTWSVMQKPVSLLTVQEAHKEYRPLTDQISTKYEQLDSGKFGSPSTPAFDAEDLNWLIYLLVWANFVKDWTCQCQRNSKGPHSSTIEDTFLIKIYTGRQS